MGFDYNSDLKELTSLETNSGHLIGLKDLPKKKCKLSPKELAIGRRIEKEHTNDPRVADRIAKQHLCEFPNYYSKGLVPMERKLRQMRK